MTGIEWLGTPQAVLAALALAITVVSANEYLQWVNRRTAELGAKGDELIFQCTSTLRDCASLILTRTRWETRAPKLWHPWRKNRLILTVWFESTRDQEKVRGTIEYSVRRFLSHPNNLKLSVWPDFRVKAPKEQANVRIGKH